ncbi:MAG TPA: hypothetical protein VL915_10555 [Gemmatimonadales bacterium]|jgi:hypothetical protein|nr:hypothetical protein [Gemmatimonadales bacterium]
MRDTTPDASDGREIFAERRLGRESTVFRSWLLQGPPSDDGERAG